jgi:hypothetical protein
LLDLVGEVVGNVRLLGEFAARARGAMTAARRRVRFIVGRGLGVGGGDLVVERTGGMGYEDRTTRCLFRGGIVVVRLPMCALDVSLDFYDAHA